MSAQTKIEWCDSTFNPWIGCTKVSPACDNCYAAVSTPARTMGIEWGAGQPRQRTSETNWKLPMKWNREPFGECQQCGLRCKGILTVEGDEHHSHQLCPDCSRASAPVYMRDSRRRVFCSSLADVFDNEVPIEWLVDLLDLIRCTPNLDWLLLTKRIGNWQARMEQAHLYTYGEERIDGKLFDWIDAWLAGMPPANVWLGATVVNQSEADRDIPKLLQVPAAVRFLSIEPMLGVIELGMCSDGASQGALVEDEDGAPFPGTIDWIICGGESGINARPMHPEWVRSLRDQCEGVGVPFFFKQWGEWVPRSACYHTFADGTSCADLDPDCTLWPQVIRLTESGGNGHQLENVDGGSDTYMQRVGKKKAGNLLDGRQHLAWPAPQEGA